MNQELPKAYSAGDYEADIYKLWEESGFFNPDNLPGKGDPYCIVMPPPNTTGILHLGHASSMAYEDLMIRFQRLQGKKTLFVPGTDHAAIATQNRVEKVIAKEGLTRQQLGREKFLERTRQYVAESQGTIKNQIRAMGTSCDWSRERYTFDDVASRAVNEVFVMMYQDGLIYRGDRIVNWCPRCASALSDDEVKYIERASKFYYLKYGPIIIATARPETKFLDKVIIVHPDDERYQQFIDKEFEVEWIQGPIKARVIADPIAEMGVGSGAMTITPAHSFVDFDLAQKYGLEVVQIIGPDGRMTEAAGAIVGLTAEEAREKVVEILQTKGLVDHIDENYKHNLSVCDRCDTPIQPLISKQWFIDVNKPIKRRGNKSLKQLATEVVRGGEIRIIPERFNKVYFHWMDNLRDWCISRQIWWGHRIPVWYKEGEDLQCAITSPGDGWEQDPDTLDTWFSSAMWTFSTLLDRQPEQYKDLIEWMKHSADLRFHPTAVLETGYDILFFWVARMIMMTEYVRGEKPFTEVYLHGLIRDDQGRKMSKSLDNGIDPIAMGRQYGMDAVRLSLIIGATPGNDLSLSESKIAGYRNFVNKIWNISRFILGTVGQPTYQKQKPWLQTKADRWIWHEYTGTVTEVTNLLRQKMYSLAAERLYEFTWSTLADWYLEMAKLENKYQPETKEKRDQLLMYILQNLLVLWHPFIPFVTEVIWKHLQADTLLMVSHWPEESLIHSEREQEDEAVTEMERVREIITVLRNARAEHKIAPSIISQIKYLGQHQEFIRQWKPIIESLARVVFVDELKSALELKGSWFTLLTDIAGQAREENQEELKAYITLLESRLADSNFTARAPEHVVAEVKRKLAEAKAKLGS